MEENELLIPAKALKKSKLRHALISFAHLSVFLIVLIVTVKISVFGFLWITPLLILLMGVMQYWLLVAVHEAVHFGLLPWPRVNDFLGKICGALITFNFMATRRSHLIHHQGVGAADDPDYYLYRKPNIMDISNGSLAHWILIASPRESFVRILNRTVSNDNSAFKVSKPDSVEFIAIFAFIQLFVLTLFVVFGNWWGCLIYWCFPLAFLPSILNCTRSICEHGGLAEKRMEGVHENELSRTNAVGRGMLFWVLNRFERFLLAPFNFNYHFEHHLFPQIPYYLLPQIHAALKKTGQYLIYPRNISNSYFLTLINFQATLAKKK